MSDKPPGSQPTYGSAIRVAQIIHWLHHQPFGLTFADLRERLGVSERTLTRYLNTLSDVFQDEDGEPLVEVTHVSSPKGRVRFRRKRYKMEGTAYELMALYLALDLMAFLDGTIFHGGAQDVLDRMQKALNHSKGLETALVLKDFHKKFFHWSEAPKDYSSQNPILEKMVNSLVRQRILEITYQSPGKPEKQHRLKPLSLLMYKRGLYLVGRKGAADGTPRDLTFAVERIKAATETEEAFAYPEDYDPGTRFERGFGLISHNEPERVLLHFDKVVAENVGSRRWHPSQKLERLNSGDLQMALTLEPGEELTAWILSYGPYVRVVEPETLRERVKSRLTAALTGYEG